MTSHQKVLSLPEIMRLFMCHDLWPHRRREYTVGDHGRDDERRIDITGRRKTRAPNFIAFRTDVTAATCPCETVHPALQ